MYEKLCVKVSMQFEIMESDFLLFLSVLDEREFSEL